MKIEARKLSQDVQEEKRKQAVRLYKTGKRYEEIADLVEVHFETVGKWVRAYRSDGIQELTSKTVNCPQEIGNRKQLKAKVLSHMRMLQKQPSRVKKCFQHPKIAYAA